MLGGSRPRSSRRPEFLARGLAQPQIERASFRPAAERPARERLPIAEPIDEGERTAEAAVQEQIAAEVAAAEQRLLAEVGSRLGEARKMLVKLSPADAEAVSAILAARGPSTLSPVATAQIEVMADATLGRGDCMVEGDVGSVDGRIATRLEELRRALADEHIEQGADG